MRATRVMLGWTQETLSGAQTRTDRDWFSALRGFPAEEEMQQRKAAFKRDLLVLDMRVAWCSTCGS